MAAWVVAEPKARIWDKFGEDMEEDKRSASRKFWQTIRCLRKVKQSSTNTVYCGGDSTGDIVGRWMEYFEDFFNPTETPSIEEAEAGN